MGNPGYIWSTSTISLSKIVIYAQSIGLLPILPRTGMANEPAMTIANDTIREMLSYGLPWKFNRSRVQPFTTVALQQDYIGVQPNGGSGGITDMGWLERGNRIDINNTATPQPNFPMEVVRDLARTSRQADPFNISWIPIPLAFYGTWAAETLYPQGLGSTGMKTSPIQQFIDVNGNYLYVSGYGTSGSSEPAAAVNAPAGTTVPDGGVTWTVANPQGAALRLSHVPPSSGLVWSIEVDYQMQPPEFTSFSQTLNPIPDQYSYIFRMGFVANCKEHNAPGSKEAIEAKERWMETMIQVLRSGDREPDNNIMYPTQSITGGSTGLWPVGPANPYGYGTGY